MTPIYFGTQILKDSESPCPRFSESEEIIRAKKLDLHWIAIRKSVQQNVSER